MVLTWVSKFTKSSFSSVSTETVPKRKAQKESNFILNYFFAEWASAMAKLLKGPLFPNVSFFCQYLHAWVFRFKFMPCISCVHSRKVDAPSKLNIPERVIVFARTNLIELVLCNALALYKWLSRPLFSSLSRSLKPFQRQSLH